ncbi:hypothetical protein GV794_02145 [Nocardia cyriacigeorgica]|uniref:Uncharacterized protein n=1 Tax=Nocardia cyriacigeorgica TaxID=135487 RepID=A0ABX0CFP0_9NOCA|nr:hypothetical protein [Nocardia cyriacigeorgica]NEW42762.1 hypothetical protein [Nocardia cyriacigeorgica]NEW53943.1 hypothetical protein [Nocardia cyriacigeorgica]NEW54468.1 hypothetical protein [Nocardia cyriacigeorgica]
MSEVLEIMVGRFVTVAGLVVLAGAAIGIADNALNGGGYTCPKCRGAGCRHCGGGEVDDTELHADEYDDGDEFEGDEWDRARDRDLDREVA